LFVEQVPMADSIHLATDIYLPSSEGAFPTILYLLPQNRRDRDRQQFCQYFIRQGYAVVIQNLRGKYGSEGEYLPFIDDLKDFKQTLEWVLEQDWCDGRIGLYGHFSSAYNAQLLASTQHPAIKALVSHSGLTKTDELFFPGGAFRLNTMYPWLESVYLEKQTPKDKWDDIFKTTPLYKTMGWDPYLLYQMARKSAPAHRIRVPVLQFTGWNDVAYRHAFYLYEAIHRFYPSTQQRLVIGPWADNYEFAGTRVGEVDFGAQSVLSYREYLDGIVRWFDHHIKGESIVLPDHHRIFMMGMNRWLNVPAYPIPESSSQRFYFRSNGQLAEEAEDELSTFTYAFDPEDPVPTYGGVNSPFFPEVNGPRDQSRFVEREDVLAFETKPLEDTLYILGKMKVVLFAGSDAPDTDFTAKLMVKKPEGMLRIIEDGIIRASHRNSRLSKEWLDENATYRMEIDLGYSGIEIRPGEQLVVHISSSNFPKYYVNHNLKDDPLRAFNYQKANQKVYAGGRFASYLEVETAPVKFVLQHLGR